MKKYLAIVLLVGLGMAFAPSCKKEKKHAPKKTHKTHVKKHKKGGVKVQGYHYLGNVCDPKCKLSEICNGSRCIPKGGIS
ncbi:hypothetical protein HN446_02025 [bacterium]|nr:hypothetical protein [bacterium]